MERIRKDQATAALRTISIYLVDSTTGAPVDSLTFAGAEMQVNKNGAGWVNAAGTISEDGGAGNGAGNYTYQLTVGDTDTEGSIKLKVDKTGTNVYIYETDIYDVEPEIEIILGMLHLNSKLDLTVFNVNGLMTSARLRVFEDATACDASTLDAADDADGEIYRFTITAVEQGTARVASYKMTRAL